MNCHNSFFPGILIVSARYCPQSRCHWGRNIILFASFSANREVHSPSSTYSCCTLACRQLSFCLFSFSGFQKALSSQVAVNVCEFQTSLTNVFYVWRSSGVFLSVRTVAGSRESVWSHLLRKLPLSICCGHLILCKVYTNWCSELKQIPVLLILMFVLCSWSELKFPLSLTFSSPANLWLQWWQIVFPKNFKLSFSGVPLKGYFSMLFFFFLSNILCV